MNVNEFGITLQFGVSFDMSGYDTLSFTFTKPSGEFLTVTGSLGTIQITTTEGIFAANTYATYRFVDGDIDETGEWSVRLTYTDLSPARLISSIGLFTIEPQEFMTSMYPRPETGAIKDINKIDKALETTALMQSVDKLRNNMPRTVEALDLLGAGQDYVTRY